MSINYSFEQPDIGSKHEWGKDIEEDKRWILTNIIIFLILFLTITGGIILCCHF